jgi:acetyl-CoA acetyltransferase
MSTAFVLTGVPTPFARYGGALAGVGSHDLAAHVIGQFVDNHPDAVRTTVDDVVLGCANRAGVEPQLRADGSPAGGLPAEAPRSTVTRSTTPSTGGIR